MWKEPADFARGPGQKGNLVDGRVEGWIVGLLADVPRSRTAERCEPVDEGWRKDAETTEIWGWCGS
jgi:hypothetical protein